MKTIIYSFFISCLLMATSCFAQTYETPPCWLSTPVTSEQMGFIGSASPFSAKINGSLISSRQQALNKLVSYYALDLDDKEIDFKQDVITINETTQVLFSTSYTDNQAMYSYAALDKDGLEKIKQQQWLAQTCPLQSCDFTKCSPSWLCKNNQASIISVSQMTTIPANQLNKTEDNAQLLLQYIKESRVDDYSYQVKSTGKYQQWGYSEHYGEIQALAQKSKLLNTDICQTPSYMFARYSYKDDDKVTSKDFDEWRLEPNLGTRSGAVGIFNGISADGLFSSAIKKAIKEGLLELAKIKHIDIDHQSYIKQKNGLFSLSKTKMSTSALVTAKLQDIKVIEAKDNLVVYAWLLETKLTDSNNE
jgi:hypothetical protein